MEKKTERERIRYRERKEGQCQGRSHAATYIIRIGLFHSTGDNYYSDGVLLFVDELSVCITITGTIIMLIKRSTAINDQIQVRIPPTSVILYIAIGLCPNF